jgi:hypothetical protein
MVSGGRALILVGVIPALLVGSSEIVVVVGEVVHEEFVFAGFVVTVIVVGFGVGLFQACQFETDAELGGVRERSAE